MKTEISMQEKVKTKQSVLIRVFLVTVIAGSLLFAYFAIFPLTIKKTSPTVPPANITDVADIAMYAKESQTALQKMDAVNLLAAADRVIIGQVMEKRNVVIQEPTETELGRVKTEYDINVLQPIAGNVTQDELITISHPGGTLPAGNRVITNGMPILNANGVYVLFLTKPGSLSPFVGLEKGVFRIFQQTDTYVVTDFLGQPTAVDATKIWRPETPVPVGEFVNQLSHSINATIIEDPDSALQDLNIPSYDSAETEQFREKLFLCGVLKWESPPAYLTTNHSFMDENDKYNTVSYSAMDQISRITDRFSFILTRDDSLEADPFVQDGVGMWYPNFIEDEILIGNMGQQGICSENESIICSDNIDCEPNNGTCEHISSPFSIQVVGFASCYEDPDHPGGFLAASIAINSDLFWWNMSYGQDYIEEVEQNSQNYQPDNTGYPLYAQVVAHELFHAIGHGHYYGADGNDELTTMLSTVTPLPKIWGRDEYIQEELYGADIEENVFSSNFYKSWNDIFTPIEPLPPGAPVGSLVNYGIVVGHNGYRDITFDVGVYWVQYDSWEYPSTWLELDKFPVALAKSNTTIQLSKMFIMPSYSGYLMVVADPDDEIAETDEFDNGQRWPRLDQMLVDVDGGWLDLRMPEEYGGDWNTVILNVDENGPPAQAELKYSLEPWQPTDDWFAQATNIPLPPLNNENFPANQDVDILVSGLQNDRVYYVGLRQIRNGYSEWEYYSPETGEVEFGAIDTHTCVPRIVSPNGGQIFLHNDPVAIRWERPGRCLGSVKLQLWQNGSIRSTITSATANDGAYLWNAVQWNGQSTNYKIKILMNNDSVSDLNDNVFNINSPGVNIRNAGFEWDYGTDFFPGYSGDNRTTNDRLPDGWQQGGWPGFIDTNEKHDGNASLKIQKTGDNTYHAWIGQDLSITPGRSYRLSGWVKTDYWDDTCFGTIHAQCLNASHNPIWSNCNLNIPLENLTKVTGQTNWQYVSYTLDANNNNARYLRAMCYHTPKDMGTDGTGEVWCDDLKLEDITPSGGKTLPYQQIPEKL